MSDAEEEYNYDEGGDEEETHDSSPEGDPVDEVGSAVDERGYAQQMQGAEDVSGQTYENEAGPSRKRPRSEVNGNGHEHPTNGAAADGHGQSGRYHAKEVSLPPSIFGVSPRNEFTTTIGEWIMTMTEGRDNVEVSRFYLQMQLVRSDRGLRRSKSSLERCMPR